MEKKKEEIEFPLEYGLIVQYDGKENMVLYDGLTHYDVGEMMCELSRVDPTGIKEIILAYPSFKDNFELDNLEKAFQYLEEAICNKYGPVVAKIITAEFLSLGEDFYKYYNDESYIKILHEQSRENKSIETFIFEDTGFKGPGGDNVGHMLLSVYAQQALSLVTYKYLFNDLMKNFDEKAQGENLEIKVMDLFGTLMGIQHIDYKIVCMDGGFTSLYTIKSSISLLAFEFVHCFENNVMFNKCKNCGKYFVPKGRVDMVYCHYPDPEHGNKLCKEIGAKIARSNKEKNDEITKLYRQKYMKYKMQVNRHPKDVEKREKLELLITDVKDWRKKLSSGAVTSEDFLNWLSNF